MQYVHMILIGKGVIRARMLLRGVGLVVKENCTHPDILQKYRGVCSRCINTLFMVK